MDLCQSNSTALDWLFEDTSTIVLSKSRGCWPWTQINPDQMVDLANRIAIRQTVYQLNQLCVLVVCPVGVIGSALNILSVFNKAVKQRDHFYIWMLIIAVMNFFFDLLFIPGILNYGALFDNVYQYSYWGTQITFLVNAIISFFSLIADMCTLALTIDRFVALCKPTLTIGRTTKRLTLAATVCVIVGVSLVRFFRVALESETIGSSSTTESNETEIIYDWVPTPFKSTTTFAVLTSLADVVIPIVLLTCMIYFSLRIAWTIALRQRNKIVVVMFDRSAASGSRRSEIEKEKREKTQATLRLLLVLVVLFLCNQFGYFLYAMAALMRRNRTVEFEMTFREIEQYVSVRLFGYGSLIIYTSMECLARSMDFYFYYALSTSIRDDFWKAIRCS